MKFIVFPTLCRTTVRAPKQTQEREKEKKGKPSANEWKIKSSYVHLKANAAYGWNDGRAKLETNDRCDT